jgi:hypothetical protein
LVNLIIYLRKHKLFLTDLKSDNIGYNDNGNIIIIDFDRTTISNTFQGINIIPNYINNKLIEMQKFNYREMRTQLNNYILSNSEIFNKLYSASISEFIYLLGFENEKSFYELFLINNKIFTRFSYPKKSNMIIKNLNKLNTNNSKNKVQYEGFDIILFNKETNKGLLANTIENIYTYEELKQLINNLH